MELLVVLPLIGIFAGVFFVSQNRGGGSLAVERSAHQIAQDLNRATEFAIRTRSHTCTAGTGLSGYGIFVDAVVMPDSYILYADCDSNRVYQAANDDIIETRFLENGAYILSSAPTAGGTFGTSFTYEPPDPSFFFRNDSGGVGPGPDIVIAATADSTIIKTVNINDKGVVTID